MRMWCVVLGSGGRQIPHIHPEASGVYYPKVPAGLGASEAGALEFGEPDAPFPAPISAPRLSVRPEEGLSVLFPSYFYHRTLPFQAEGQRITIAFDLVPSP
jgi:uncharacterized protein (TIGR02466 family)